MLFPFFQSKIFKKMIFRKKIRFFAGQRLKRLEPPNAGERFKSAGRTFEMDSKKKRSPESLPLEGGMAKNRSDRKNPELSGA